MQRGIRAEDFSKDKMSCRTRREKGERAKITQERSQKIRCLSGMVAIVRLLCSCFRLSCILLPSETSTTQMTVANWSDITKPHTVSNMCKRMIRYRRVWAACDRHRVKGVAKGGLRQRTRDTNFKQASAS